MTTRNVQRLTPSADAGVGEAFAIQPLTPAIGAEIEGVDLSQEVGPELFAALHQALLAHHVLVFRDQILTPEDHKRFGRLFGRLHSHPYHMKDPPPGQPRPDPEILVVKADANSRYVNGEEWHTDVTCHDEPPMGSMLYLTRTPEIGSGGDTLFASTVAAYETLSAPIKALLEGLSAVHEGQKLYTDRYDIAPPPEGWPRAVHPVVVRIPETGRKALFVNRSFTRRIVELDKHESDALLEMLWRHVEATVELQCRVRWRPNTLVFWDNRATQHRAVWDYFPNSRYGQRVSIIGERPVR